jgi:hypothetical protein
VVACTPHPGFGTVRVQKPEIVQVVNLATCGVRTLRSRAKPTATPGLRVAVTRTSQTIVYRGRTVLVVREDHSKAPAGMPGPIVLQGVSPDRRWIFYAIDPQGSASLMADGLVTRVISAHGGRSFPLGLALNYGDYRAWCGGRLVFTAGGDREATIHKQLEVAAPPLWRPHALTVLKGRAWGALACAPEDRSVIVQSQPAEELRSFFSTRWQLWRVGLDGRASRLTSPPPMYADESPSFGPGGRLFFVRSRRGVGHLYALGANGRPVGPLLALGYSLGYYGANAWSYTVRTR